METLTQLFDCWVYRHAISDCKPVGLVRHADDGKQFPEHLVGHACATGGRRVARHTICAVVGHADRNVEQLFDQRIQCSRRHDVLEAMPRARKRRRVIRDEFPEVVDVVHLTGVHNIVVHRADRGCALVVLDRTWIAHVLLLDSCTILPLKIMPSNERSMPKARAASSPDTCPFADGPGRVLTTAYRRDDAVASAAFARCSHSRLWSLAWRGQCLAS